MKKYNGRDGMTRTGGADYVGVELDIIPDIELKEVFDAITSERQYQDAKWGTTLENPHRVPEWIDIMRRELNEAVQGMIDFPGKDEVLREILQVVSVGVACLQQHGIFERANEGGDNKS